MIDTVLYDAYHASYTYEQIEVFLNNNMGRQIFH